MQAIDFTVDYDPSKGLTPEKTLKTIEKLRYKPSLYKPIRVSSEAAASKVDAVGVEVSLSPGKQGTLLLTLAAKDGKTLSSPKLSAEAPEGVTVEAEGQSPEGSVTGQHVARIPVQVAKGVKAGFHTVTIKVRYEADGKPEELKLHVPVQVE